MYKLLILSKTTNGAASSIAEFDSQESADIAFTAILHQNDLLGGNGFEILVIKLYLRV